MGIYRKIFKRLFDILLASFLLILTAPIFLVLTILQCINFPCNPLFAQSRIGYKNRVFKVLKFRKLREIFDNNGNPLPEEQRITRLGKFIRQSSLDELPQLINILLGQMSFIGPRPLLDFYLPYYTPREIRRHQVRPGLTGWAQVHGRALLEWDKRFEYDLYYLENLNIWLDIKILYLTVKSVFQSFTQETNNTKTTLPRFVKWRAYIRMPWNQDDVHIIIELLKKGHTGKALHVFNGQKEQFLNRNSKNYLLLLDDYQDQYNSFVLVEIQQNSAVIIDSFIGNSTYLPHDEMKLKYIQVIHKYLSDLGYKNIQLNGEIKL